MYIITAKRWFQKTYGNTYHSVKVEQINETEKKTIGYIPFRYGYDSQYMNTAAEIIGISETSLRKDMIKNLEKYHVTVTDVLRKKDL
jgi:hypothetical protein